MVPRKSEEEVRGSYIGLRRHHHLPAADVRCQIYFLLHTFVYVSHAIVNILYVYPSVSYANVTYITTFWGCFCSQKLLANSLLREFKLPELANSLLTAC